MAEKFVIPDELKDKGNLIGGAWTNAGSSYETE